MRRSFRFADETGDNIQLKCTEQTRLVANGQETDGCVDEYARGRWVWLEEEGYWEECGVKKKCTLRLVSTENTLNCRQDYG